MTVHFGVQHLIIDSCNCHVSLIAIITEFSLQFSGFHVKAHESEAFGS